VFKFFKIVNEKQITIINQLISTKQQRYSQRNLKFICTKFGLSVLLYPQTENNTLSLMFKDKENLDGEVWLKAYPQT